MLYINGLQYIAKRGLVQGEGALYDEYLKGTVPMILSIVRVQNEQVRLIAKNNEQITDVIFAVCLFVKVDLF